MFNSCHAYLRLVCISSFPGPSPSLFLASDEDLAVFSFPVFEGAIREAVLVQLEANVCPLCDGDARGGQRRSSSSRWRCCSCCSAPENFHSVLHSLFCSTILTVTRLLAALNSCSYKDAGKRRKGRNYEVKRNKKTDSVPSLPSDERSVIDKWISR